MNHKDELVTFKIIAEATSAVVGKDFLKELVKNLSEVIDAYGAWITEVTNEGRTLRAVAMWLNGKFIENFEHDLKGTPCGTVLANPSGIYHIPDNIIQLFPYDEPIKEHGGVSYMGI